MARNTLWLDFRVKGFHPDPETNQPILVLEEAQGRFLLPIWIGMPEAGAIAAHLGGHTLPRPMTHDLTHALVTLLGGQVVRLDVRDIVDGTFHADLIVRDPDGTVVFVEVRSRSRAGHGGALASIGATKRQRIVYAARCYLSRMKHLPACRFDVVVVQSGELQWIKAAFGC